MDPEKFHLPGKHYFLSHSVGAQPKTYDAAVTAGYAQPWRTEGFNVWEPWFETLNRFRAGLAPIIGAAADDIVPQANVSSGVSKILFGLPPRKGRNKIVLTEDDFPTVGFALDQGRRMGYELVFLPGGARLADPDAWSRAFADDVQMVVATQVYSNTSVLSPVAEIARLSRAADVFCLVDAAQSAGAVPLRLDEWRPDFAVGTSLKYLCGGTGAAWLWAGEQAAAKTAPRDVGWFSHADPFELDIHHFEYAPGAARFTGGTPSIAPFAGACAGHEIINARGVEAIYTHNQGLLSRLAEALPARAFLSSTKIGARGSSALIKVQDYERAAKALAQIGAGHDTRKGAVRISVHLYNDESDIDAFAAAIEPQL